MKAAAVGGGGAGTEEATAVIVFKGIMWAVREVHIGQKRRKIERESENRTCFRIICGVYSKARRQQLIIELSEKSYFLFYGFPHIHD